MRFLSLLLFLVVVGWTVGQPDTGNLDDDDEDETPRPSVPRFRLIRNRWVDPTAGGLLPSTSAIVQASSVHAALDLLAQREQSANLSVSLCSADNGENIASIMISQIYNP